MEPQEYTRMFELEDRHWWFQGRLELTRRILARFAPPVEGRRARMLDIGCGTGMLLEREGKRFDAFGLDFSLQALRYTRRRGISKLLCADSQRIPVASGWFDLVTAFDLIEHVQGDEELVSEVHRILRPGGVLVATVPAHPFLWSDHDRALHHKRRYRKRDFDALFDPQKWIERRMTYSFAAIFAPAAAVRAARKLLPPRAEAKADTRMTNALLNRGLIGLHRIEAAWIERFDAPFGLSILTVREKRA